MEEKHSGVLLLLSFVTHNVSFRERARRSLGRGSKNPGGSLAPWRMCKKWAVSGDGLSPSPIPEPCRSWESQSYKAWDGMECVCVCACVC